MAREASAIVGSGLNPLKKQVCLNETTQERHLRGTAVAVLNPEDSSAGCSGAVTALTVGSSVVKLPETPLKYRRAVSVLNNSSEDILYIGFDPGVTVSNGWPLNPGGCISFDANGDIILYGVSNGTNTDVRILELS